MKKALLLIGSFISFIISNYYFPLFFLLLAYILLIVGFYKIVGNLTINFFLFFLVALGCFLIEKSEVGFLLFFVYSILYISLYLVEKKVLDKKVSLFGDPEKKITVITGKIKKKKMLCELEAGDIVSIRKGEVCHVEGMITRGNSNVSLRNVLGKDQEFVLSRGSRIQAGSINLGPELLVSVTIPFQKTLLSRYRNSLLNRKVNKYSRLIVPFIFLHLAALFLFIFLIVYDFKLHAIEYFLMFSLIFFFDFSEVFSFVEQSFILFLQKKGIYILNNNKLISLALCENFIFTKTGVLTLGNFSVTGIAAEDGNEKELLESIAYAEYNSSNRIGKCITNYCKDRVSIEQPRIKEFQEFPNGVLTIVDDSKILVGNYQFMLEHEITVDKSLEVGTNLYVVRDDVYLGSITISDKLLTSVKEEIAKLKELGVKHLTTFSKDNERITRAVSNTLGIQDCYSGLTLKDRLFWIQYLKDMHGENQVYVSDEECRYPVDTKVVFSDAGDSKGDIVILEHDFSKITYLYELCQKYISWIKTWLLSGVFFKCFLVFILLWIRDILVLGGILIGGVLLFFTWLFFLFYIREKGGYNEKNKRFMFRTWFKRK